MQAKIPSRTLFVMLFLSCLPFFPSLHAQSCNWTAADDAPLRQVEAVSVVVNGKMYVFNGFDSTLNDVTEGVSVFDPSASSGSQWSTAPDVPFKVNHTDVVAVEDEIWVIGGFAGNHGGLPTDTVQIFNTQTQSWRAGPSLPAVHASGGVGLVGRVIHVFAGLSSRTANKASHWAYDLDAPSLGWQTETPHPYPRCHMGSASLGGMLYTVGGQTGHDKSPVHSDRVERYDPITKEWQTSVAQLPAPRTHIECGTFAIDGQLYVTGGTQDGSPSMWRSILRFHPDTNQWVSTCNLPHYYFNVTSTVIDNKMILTHGGVNSFYNPRRTTYLSDFSRTSVFELAPHPDTLRFEVYSGERTQRTALVFTSRGTSPIAPDPTGWPGWLRQVIMSPNEASPTAAEVEVHIDAQGLGLGVHAFDLEIEDNAGPANYRPATLRVEVEVETLLDGTQLDFQLERRDAVAQLSWRLDDPSALAALEVQRRTLDTENFETFARFTSELGREHALNDPLTTLATGPVAYRLRGIRPDGSSILSRTHELRWEGLDRFTLTPQANGSLLLAGSFAAERVTASLYDWSGQRLFEKSAAVENGRLELSLPVNGRSCIVRLNVADRSYTRKVGGGW